MNQPGAAESEDFGVTFTLVFGKFVYLLLLLLLL